MIDDIVYFLFFVKIYAIFYICPPNKFNVNSYSIITDFLEI